jgi:hypothetical protein
VTTCDLVVAVEGVAVEGVAATDFVVAVESVAVTDLVVAVEGDELWAGLLRSGQATRDEGDVIHRDSRIK